MTGMDSESWIGSTLVDKDGIELGEIREIYFEQRTGVARWMTVATGMSEAGHSFVPLAGATPVDDVVQTPYTITEIGDAPEIESFEDLRSNELRELYAHYDVPWDDAPQREVAEREVIVHETVLPRTDNETQAQDDMLVATGHDPYAPVVVQPGDGDYDAPPVVARPVGRRGRAA